MDNIKTYAVISLTTHVIQNVILWDGRTESLTVVDAEGNEQVIPPWQPPEGMCVACIEGTEAGIGWKLENGAFIDVRDLVLHASQQSQV